MSSPLLPRKDTKSTESAWARRVKIRDEYKCQFEVQGVKSFVFLRCLGAATDAAHIYRRHQCGKAKFEDEVGLAACRTHHQMFDSYDPHVRVPIVRLQAAYDKIVSMCKVNTLGPRPI